MASKSVKLNAKWQLDAAMLSRPVDLTALVALSQQAPKQFFCDDVCHVMVSRLLNSDNGALSDKDTKLDVLTILGNLAAVDDRECKRELRSVLQGVNKWFDDYLFREEVAPAHASRRHLDLEGLSRPEPELHKAMLVLLARSFDYRLKTEDLLELTGGSRVLALEVLVGILEEGETYVTALTQRQAPGVGVGPAQWEHELVCRRHERPLILQMCRLLRGFTHPTSYFTEDQRRAEAKDGTTEYDIGVFCEEMTSLLETTVRSRLVEKLSVALHAALFMDGNGLGEEDVVREDASDGSGDPGPARGAALLCESDHLAVAAIHEFLQNLYTYATADATADFRQHILAETLLIPRLVLPYLDRCAVHAGLLCRKAEENARDLARPGVPADALVGEVSALALEYPALAQGVATSLRTLVIASFRAPPTRFVLGLLRRLNPTASLLRAGAFVVHHDYLLALVCLVNVNMGALDLSASIQSEDAEGNEEAQAGDRGALPRDDKGGSEGIAEAYYATMLQQQLGSVVQQLSQDRRRRVLQRVCHASALPIMRDTPSFAAVLAVLAGDTDPAVADLPSRPRSRQAGNGSGDRRTSKASPRDGESRSPTNLGEIQAFRTSRSEAKEASATRVRQQQEKQQLEETEIPGFRLLGDLPPIEQARGRERISVELVVPDLDQAPRMRLKAQRRGKRAPQPRNASPAKREDAKEAPEAATTAGKRESRDVKRSAPGTDVGPFAATIPEDFACGINGHLMRDPVRTPAGQVFERETILLWLQTRGHVCPRTGDALAPGDLNGDAGLRDQILRWQITNLMSFTGANDGDDPYDF